jgi:hypothetical protein
LSLHFLIRVRRSSPFGEKVVSDHLTFFGSGGCGNISILSARFDKMDDLTIGKISIHISNRRQASDCHLPTVSYRIDDEKTGRIFRSGMWVTNTAQIRIYYINCYMY